MQEIDVSTWKRREHFEFFRRMDLPFYNVNLNVDITGLPEFSKSHALSLNGLLIHLTVSALNRTENFRYRLREDTVVLHDKLHPSFAHLKNGEELFRMITVDFCDDPFEFDKAVKKEIECTKDFFNIHRLIGRDDLVFISPLPWFSFTGVDHTLNLKKNDAIPRISFGKYFVSSGKQLLPFNIQVNHIFVDGLHVGHFFEELDRIIAAQIRLAPHP